MNDVDETNAERFGCLCDDVSRQWYACFSRARYSASIDE